MGLSGWEGVGLSGWEGVGLSGWEGVGLSGWEGGVEWLGGRGREALCSHYGEMDNDVLSVWLCDMCCVMFCGECDVLCCDVKHLLLPRDG